MPHALTAGDVIELKIFTNLQFQDAINTLHYRVTSITGGAATDTNFGVAMAAIIAPLVKAWMPATAVYKGIRVQKIDPLPLPVAIVNLTGNGVGAKASDAAPPQVALVVSKLTDFAGSANRGRMYASFFAEDSNDADGYPSAGVQALVEAFAAAVLVPQTIVIGAVTLSVAPCIWRRETRTKVDITTWRTRDRWATQRSRSAVNRGDDFRP